jgi:hypothetical protein
MASARPMSGCDFPSPTARVMRSTVGWEFTAQCETSSERAPA